MFEDCAWTPTRILHEIIADLQSLQGFWVEWDERLPLSTQQYLVQVSTSDGKFFQIDMSIMEDLGPWDEESC